jgi:hypothetical protein
VLRSGGKVACAEEVGCDAGWSRGEEWLKPALVEWNWGAGGGWSRLLATRFRSDSLVTLWWIDGKGGAG